MLSDTGFTFFGNALWVDFLNTEPARPDGARADLIREPDGFGRWVRRAGLLPDESPFRPDQQAVGEALRFRAALRKGAESLTAARPLPESVLAAVNDRLAANPAVPKLVRKDGGWALEPQSATPSTAALLGRLAADFAQTLAAGRTDRLRRCEHAACVMMFIDTSKNGSRRWCSMETCGNREKAAGHRARTQGMGLRQ